VHAARGQLPIELSTSGLRDEAEAADDAAVAVAQLQEQLDDLDISFVPPRTCFEASRLLDQLKRRAPEPAATGAASFARSGTTWPAAAAETRA
jgi:hypothetical protein